MKEGNDQLTDCRRKNLISSELVSVFGGFTNANCPWSLLILKFLYTFLAFLKICLCDSILKIKLSF